MKKTDILYGLRHQEELNDSVEDVVEYQLEGDTNSAEEIIEFRRVAVKDWGGMGGRVLERVLEELDEEYGDPNGDFPEPTKAMKEAADTFMKVVLDEYVPWNCEPTGRRFNARGELMPTADGRVE